MQRMPHKLSKYYCSRRHHVTDGSYSQKKSHHHHFQADLVAQVGVVLGLLQGLSVQCHNSNPQAGGSLWRMTNPTAEGFCLFSVLLVEIGEMEDRATLETALSSKRLMGKAERGGGDTER